MARDKRFATNIDNSSPLVYPNGRIQDNTGSGNGTPVNNYVYSDLHEMKDKLMRLYNIDYNGLPDNETNGFQTVDALRALASKNDFVLDLTVSSGILQVPVKLGYMLEKESILCIAGFNLGAETQIKGIDSVTYTIASVGSFKIGEYVRLIKTVSGITLIREVDAVNLNLAVSELSYLKKATQSEENAGAIDTVGTTPLTNLTSFIRRVNGTDSATYLATSLQNGIYPKEHFDIVANIGASPVRNIGTASGININSGSISTNYAVTGNIVSAILVDKPVSASTIRIVLANTMTDSNYIPKMYVESQSSIIGLDNGIGIPVFKIINATTFDFSIQQFQSQAQNLKIHFEVKKL